MLSDYSSVKNGLMVFDSFDPPIKRSILSSSKGFSNYEVEEKVLTLKPYYRSGGFVLQTKESIYTTRTTNSEYIYEQ